jgi:type III restriction enzyme
MARRRRRVVVVDKPIINNPYEEPNKHWVFEEKQPRLVEERRPAGFFVAQRTRDNSAPVATEQLILYDEQSSLAPVNEIRRRVKQWRGAGYPGTTRITKELLQYWNDPNRERKLFYCQREAAETVIWLIEAPTSEKQGIIVPVDEPSDQRSLENGYSALKRYCPKIATGTGKTVVMAMLIAWSVLNKLFNKQDRRFSDAVLVICPSLTVRRQDAERLTPSNPKNFYEKFDLVPSSLVAYLSKGRYLVTNWHLFLPEVDPETRVVQRGDESDSAFCRRTLRELGEKENILVLNDEAHHAHRPAPIVEKYQQIKLVGEEKERFQEEIEEATRWVSALDRINKIRGINFCVDFTATPFFIGGSGHLVGEPFPWIISDFNLVDAIESGICKIPRVPVDDNSGQPIARFFRLWQWIMERLSSADRAKKTRKPNPEAVYRQAEGALTILASEWKKTLDNFEKYESRVPPVMIIVCSNTDLAEVFHDRIAKGQILDALKNDGKEFTIRIDSKLLSEAERQLNASAHGANLGKAEELRQKVNTIGKIGELGEQVRCVVSVSMLTEGWDAQNVTQILGLRAFDSQLLCEQVVGRGLRRTNYDDLSEPEYVDVYGVPFEVIPVQKASLTRPNPPQRLPTLVRALPERKPLEIRFPRVEGYIYDVRRKVIADIDKLPVLYVSPANEPTEVVVKPASGITMEKPTRLWPGEERLETRDEFLKTHRLQTTIFEIASQVTSKLAPETRPFVFPQVLEITKQYVEKKVKVRPGASIDEIVLGRYSDSIISRLCDAIQPDVGSGEAPLLPRIEYHRNFGSTSEVRFSTLKEAFGTVKSHVSHVVVDSGWEHKVAYELDKNPDIIAYVKNDHLDFTIPYEWEHEVHSYYPDFIVRLKLKDGSEVNIILEVKGYESEKDRAKKPAAQRWVSAVNHHGSYGRWVLKECRSPYQLPKMIENTKHEAEEIYCAVARA